MDWEGETMWMVETNSSGTASGEVRRIGMDGMGAENDIEGLVRAHHDLAVAPGGIVAFLVGAGTSGVSDLVERSPDGTLRTVATLDGTVFKSRTGTSWHANSIQFHPTDESYTVGDRDAWAYVKLTRQGELLWQLGSECEGAPAPKCANAGAHGDHGHQLLDDGTFLSFSTGNPSVAYEHSITETASSLTANLVWSYSAPDRFSTVLGDVQRLPNGNTLVVYSTTGWMHEVSEAGELVRVIRVHSASSTSSSSFGYVNFRETLYGAPIR